MGNYKKGLTGLIQATNLAADVYATQNDTSAEHSFILNKETINTDPLILPPLLKGFEMSELDNESRATDRASLTRNTDY